MIVLTALAGASVGAGDAAAERRMVVTFDDLPFVGAAGPSGAGAATGKLLRAMTDRGAQAVGFVNEGKLAGGEAEGISILKQWVDAGMTLGNHTFSHADLNALTVEAFQEEIARGDSVSRGLMAPKGPYSLYFRHPMTRTGDTQAKKEAIEAFLAERGYRVAPHTVENSDFVFNALYAHAQRGGDRETAQRVRAAYLSFTSAALDFAERIAPEVFGRDIPQTLLLHANLLNADCLEEMLSGFEARGYRFVSLDEAMADPAYRTKDTLVSPRGPTWLWRWMKSRGMSVSFKDDPEPPAWVLEAYRALRK
jgi:peptidoglycan/xylan/chitin deacetylase (PgdA/CDA1 family)